MTTVEGLIEDEKKKLALTTSAKESANTLYNLIFLMYNTEHRNHTYKDIKKFLDYYIESLKSENFGYDNFNYGKIDSLVNLLSPSEKISILQYAISITSRELPEYDRDWFIKKKHEVEIKDILVCKKKTQYPKAILLYCSHNVTRLLLTLTAFFLLVFTILLPSPIDNIVAFTIRYEQYSDNFYLNHLLNVLSLFADLDNNLQIIPNGVVGFMLIFLGKVFFITLIVNFIYIRLSDKISLR